MTELRPIEHRSRGRKNMKDLVLFVVIIAGWIALQRWVLPSLGIPT